MEAMLRLEYRWNRWRGGISLAVVTIKLMIGLGCLVAAAGFLAPGFWSERTVQGMNQL